VDVIRDGELVDGMGPGDMFGEAALRAGALRNAAAPRALPFACWR
jgi:CRP-like cAMP-binding protein